MDTGIKATTVRNENDGTTVVANLSDDDKNDDGTVDLGVTNANTDAGKSDNDEDDENAALQSGSTTSIQGTEHGSDGTVS